MTRSALLLRRSILLPAVLLAGWLAAPTPTPAAPRGAALDELVDRTLAYVGRFYAEMEGAVLDERYVQAVKKPCCIESRDPGTEPFLAWDAVAKAKGVVERRRLVSEVLLVPVSGGMKIGYRDVSSVDGKEVRSRDERMQHLFASGGSDGEVALGRIASESSRFNLGPLRRNANLPTMPLLYLVPAMRDRLHFASGGTDRRDGRELARIEVREDGSPTLVSDAAGQDNPARLNVWVEPESGAVREVELRFGERARRVLHVWFRDEPRLDSLVPDRMWEWYERIQMPGQTWPVDLVGLATYDRVKLFTVSTSEESGQEAN